MLDYLMELGLKAGDWLLVIGDPLLGWMLHLPRDLTLVLLAVMTGVIMTVIRRFTTNQDLLRRCKEDKARLGVLMSEAKSVGDKERIKNIRKIGRASCRERV